MFYKLVVERMEIIGKIHNSIYFNNLTHHYEGPTTNVDFNNFTDVANLFADTKSKRINLVDRENKWEVQIENITNLYDVRNIKIILQ